MPARILAVDDNLQILNLTLKILKYSGYDARGLTDPREVSGFVQVLSARSLYPGC